MLKNKKVLLLNTDYIPIKVLNWQDAFVSLYIKNNTIALDFYPDEYKIKDGRGRKYPIPAVLIRKKYIHRPFKKISFSKRAVFARDNNICQYCTRSFSPAQLTVDHVVPLSKGGERNSFLNTVTACKHCNRKKGNHLCEKIGMHPINQPGFPNQMDVILGILNITRFPVEWKIYIENLPGSFKQKVLYEGE